LDTQVTNVGDIYKYYFIAALAYFRNTFYANTNKKRAGAEAPALLTSGQQIVIGSVPAAA
jgi:hypothetical protein